MQLARNELFARSALAHDEDAARNRRDARNGLTQRAHRRAVADECRLAIESRAKRVQLLHEAATGDGVLDLLDDALDRLGLVDESVRTKANGLDAALVVAGAGVDDDRRVDAALLQTTKHLEAVDARHLEVEDDAIDRLAAEDIERFVAAGRHDRAVAADAFQVVGILLGHRRDVIDHQDLRHHVRFIVPVGMSIVMRVPLPGVLSTPSVPWRSITSLRTMERPRPVPPSFVV